MIFDMGQENDVVTSTPWGPIELWGPTETRVDDINDGYAVSAADVRFLMDKHNAHYRETLKTDDIVSFRCGIRPLAVDARYSGSEYPLALSRGFKISQDSERSWISVHGGKITGCDHVAAAAARALRRLLPEPSSNRPRFNLEQVVPPSVKFPGLEEEVTDPGWASANEFCCTLDDYLRRRTNIAQWIAREGLGRNDENMEFLRKLSLELSDGDTKAADRQLQLHRERVADRFDSVLSEV
jgi:glycerol-3-phosphate dehydrogenase